MGRRAAGPDRIGRLLRPPLAPHRGEDARVHPAGRRFADRDRSLGPPTRGPSDGGDGRRVLDLGADRVSRTAVDRATRRERGGDRSVDEPARPPRHRDRGRRRLPNSSGRAAAARVEGHRPGRRRTPAHRGSRRGTPARGRRGGHLGRHPARASSSFSRCSAGTSSSYCGSRMRRSRRWSRSRGPMPLGDSARAAELLGRRDRLLLQLEEASRAEIVHRRPLGVGSESDAGDHLLAAVADELLIPDDRLHPLGLAAQRRRILNVRARERGQHSRNHHIVAWSAVAVEPIELFKIDPGADRPGPCSEDAGSDVERVLVARPRPRRDRRAGARRSGTVPRAPCGPDRARATSPRRPPATHRCSRSNGRSKRPGSESIGE